jgi:hypothetical protein
MARFDTIWHGFRDFSIKAINAEEAGQAILTRRREGAKARKRHPADHPRRMTDEPSGIPLRAKKMEGQEPNHVLAPILPASQRPGSVITNIRFQRGGSTVKSEQKI